MSLAVEPLPTLNKYEVLEEIGHGGMATVYRALDTRLGREVAVKIIHRHLRESSEVGRRFTDEARAVAKLRHQGIVEIYDVSDDDEQNRFLVAELVRGRSFRKWLTDHKPMPVEAVACVVLEIAEALDHAHINGIVHRDIKPENVLIGEGPPVSGPVDEPTPVEIKITDFGIAKLLDQQGVTSTGQVLGSPAYMSPEQIECGDVDARADIYSLGVLFYEAAVGALPFDGKNPAQVLRRVLDGRYNKAEHERAAIGARWSTIIDRMLAHDAAKRPASMRELITLIRAELVSVGVIEPASEVARYFADPRRYEDTQGERLVPKLLELGERAQLKGDVLAAAAHFNRALTLKPGDPTILALISRLSRRQSRRANVIRSIAALGITLFVGVSAWAVVRLTRSEPRQATPLLAMIETPSDTVKSAAPIVVTPPASVVLIPSSASTVAPSSAVTAITTSTAPTATTRAVNILTIPKTARVSIDGGAPEESGFDGVHRTFHIGEQHTIDAFVPNSPCCKKGGRTFVVEAPPRGAENQPQVVSLSLQFNAARLVSQGPAGSQLSCPGFKVSGSSRGSYEVSMNTLEDRQTCSLTEGGQVLATQSILLYAGKETSVTWTTPTSPTPH
ncbi:MAG: serine/threonine-protein kinase [Polyangiaceae bacterium]